jgi:hypothetical protein
MEDEVGAAEVPTSGVNAREVPDVAMEALARLVVALSLWSIFGLGAMVLLATKMAVNKPVSSETFTLMDDRDDDE